MLCNLNDVLGPAREQGYAVGLFNTVSLEMTEGIFQAAEALRAPVIVGTAEVLLPYASLEAVADLTIARARRTDVPVVVHYDHGLTFERCMRALQLGFSSVMYDCSTDTYEENVKKLAEMTKIAHAMGATVEGELGHVGDNEGAGKLQKPSDYYTDPTQAQDFVRRTGVDALAIAVGNAHGDYKFPPKLDFARIAAMKEAVKVPLVLHGGSGLTDDDFRTAIARGISKVNIFTDINKAQARGAREALDGGAVTGMELTPYEISAVRAQVEEKMKLFSCVGKG